jgi:hypothetical protein
MKLPSIQLLVRNAANVIRRFPMEIILAFIAVCAASAYTEINQVKPEAADLCLRLLMASYIGFLVTLCITLFVESRKYTAKTRAALYGAGILIPIGLFFLINPMLRQSDYLRFLLLVLGFHLLVSFSPFPLHGNINAFWQFNKTIFLRFITGALYSAVLYLGIAAAIGSMNLLFNFDFEWDTFLILWIWIVGLFQTFFFLAGVPANFQELQAEHSYPKGLKVFTQYVLIPLASFYLFILLAYELKILLEWNMPKGLVSSLILGYAVFGILSFLLVYPIQDQAENRWIRNFTRSFYFMLIPLLLLLYLAIIARISNYGVTEERYFLIVLALWLTFITCYFLFSIQKNIMLIPLSLCIVSLLAVYGPQSAFSVAKNSQLDQLTGILERNRLLKDMKIQPVTRTLDSADRVRVPNIIRYLSVNHGLESLQPVVTENLEVVSDSIRTVSREKRNKVAEMWDIRQMEEKWLSDHYKIFGRDITTTTTHHERYATARAREAISVSGADYLLMVSTPGDTVKTTLGDKTNLSCAFTGDNYFRVTVNGATFRTGLDTLVKRVNDEVLKTADRPRSNSRPDDSMVDVVSAAHQIQIPREVLTHRFSFRGYRFTLLINYLTLSDQEELLKLQHANGVLLIKRN